MESNYYHPEDKLNELSVIRDTHYFCKCLLLVPRLIREQGLSDRESHLKLLFSANTVSNLLFVRSCSFVCHACVSHISKSFYFLALVTKSI